MKKLYVLLISLAITLTVLTAGCSGGGNENFPDPGFTIVTQRVNSLGIPTAVPGVTISGQLNRPPDINAQGTKSSFPPTASSYRSALVPVADGIAPAFWEITSHTGPFNWGCSGQTAFGGVKRGEANYLSCIEFRISLPFTFVPSALDAEGASATWIVTGTNLNCTYGMPTLQVYDETGTLVRQTQATSAAGDSTWVSGTSEELRNLPSGVYVVDIWNATADGAGEPAGATVMRIYRASELPPDSDGDGYRADMDCNDNDPMVYPGAITYCTLGSDRNCNAVDDYDECNGGGGGCGSDPNNPAMDCGTVY